MVSSNSLAVKSDSEQQARNYWLKGNYTQAASLYEQAIEAEPNNQSYYWHLGLMLLLEGQEAEAQTTWLLAMAQGEEEQVTLWTEELLEVLQTEAERQRLELKDYGTAWAIRQHMREINPTDINNLLHSIGLSTLLGTYTGAELKELGVIDMLNSEAGKAVDSELLMEVWKNVLDCAPFSPSSLEFTEVSLIYINDINSFVEDLISLAERIAYSAKQYAWAARFIKLGLQLAPQNLELLFNLACFYQDSWQFLKGIETANSCYNCAEKTVEKVYANHLIMRGLMVAGGYWDEVCSTLERHKSLIASLLEEQPNLDIKTTLRLYVCVFFFPYFQDRGLENGTIRSQVAQLAQLSFANFAKEQVERYRKVRSPIIKVNAASKKLKIGYISYCLRCHSVGWLARWLFEYHDRDCFEINAYLVGAEQTSDSLQEWYISKASKAYRLGLNGWQIAEKIYEDEIDILVDLDSITMTTTCETMALKPAPIQVSWLGWDASGIPTIDYYIADPYVLPESAQEYYSEKIWRLPQTYIAVDGFEVALPTLRREQINIPNDAIVYYSGQRGYKYNPQTIKLQMQIIKAVPNSYLLFKDYADQEALKNFFIKMAEEEGVSRERLRFLPMTASESEHRANLGIADVVLDTYPYNGATTTLETLWMGIPLVTRVGEQFSARNSYAMMINAGVKEGIAWTDREYVEWGIRLGNESALRQQIAWKLRQSRQNSPLWNAKEFTREMENAFQQMWQRYIEKCC